MFRWVLVLSILFPWVAHTNESIAEQQQAMGEIFSQMGVASEAQHWGFTYIQLINQNLPKRSQYKGEICRVNIRLHPNGSVRRVTILPPPPNEKSTNRELLCNDVFLTVYRLKRFPMPKQDDVGKKLQNINLTVTP